MQLKINQYDTVETGEYNGKWQIKVGRVDQEGNFRPHFQSIKKKDGSQINVPVSLTFEDTLEHPHSRLEFLNLCASGVDESDMYVFVSNQADLHGYELVKKQQPPQETDVPF
jgi:hypothetical protein